MIKKVVLFSLLAGLVGLLVFGAVNRTLARSSENGPGLGNQENSTAIGNAYQAGEGQQGQRLNARSSQSSSQSNEYDWQYSEDHEPLNLGEGTGYGRNNQDLSKNGIENPGGGYQGGNQNGSGNKAENYGEGQAQVTDVLNLEGFVTSVDENILVVETTAGETIEISNRGWWFAVESGFSAQLGDQLSLTGFYESEDQFEVISMQNQTNGQSVSMREETGRPLWAGGGRGRGRNP